MAFRHIWALRDGWSIVMDSLRCLEGLGPGWGEKIEFTELQHIKVRRLHPNREVVTTVTCFFGTLCGICQQKKMPKKPILLLHPTWIHVRHADSDLKQIFVEKQYASWNSYPQDSRVPWCWSVVAWIVSPDLDSLDTQEFQKKDPQGKRQQNVSKLHFPLNPSPWLRLLVRLAIRPESYQ